MKKFIAKICTNPFYVIVAVFVALGVLGVTSNIGGFLAGGVLSKVLTAFVGSIVLMVVVSVAMYMRVLFRNGDPNGIAHDPQAKAILLGSVYVAFALVVTGAFIFPL